MPGLGALPAESVTVSTTAVGISTYPGASSGRLKAGGARIYVDGQPVRYWKDGTVPTASVGLRGAAGDVIELYDPGEVLRFLAIREGGADAILRVQPYVHYQA